MHALATPDSPTFVPVADHGLLVCFGDTISADVSAAVIALDRALAVERPHGLRESVPALVNLLIDFDPLVTDHAEMGRAVVRLLETTRAAEPEGKLHELDVCYEDVFAADLGAVASVTGMSIEAVIACHLRGDYRVRMYGFAPGYAYLSGVPLEIQVPRKPAAVRGVAAGSVLVAGPQCLVTTLDMPSGWSIIGRSPTRILTGIEQAPFLFDVGDKVRFRRIAKADFERCLAAGSA